MSFVALVFSQNKASAKTVSDIWVNGTNLHVQYSDGSGKDMAMPPATSLQVPSVYARNKWFEKRGYATLQEIEVANTGHSILIFHDNATGFTTEVGAQ